LNGLLSASVLFGSMVLVVAFGILAAYATVVFILSALAPRSKAKGGNKSVIATPRAHAAHAGGD